MQFSSSQDIKQPRHRHCEPSFFFFNDTATTEIYTLSLHDALPIFLIGALSPIVILLTAVCISLTVWRARLEEDALARHSGEYRDYAKRTGFLLPRRRAWRPLAEGR